LLGNGTESNGKLARSTTRGSIRGRFSGL